MSSAPVIAIVDDDQAMREALFDLLQEADLAARTFDSAASFLADDAAGDGCDILLTDVRMPGMDGLELQRRLRAMGSSLPVIFVTSSADRQTRMRAMAEGAFAYLTKPVAHDILLEHLHAALARGGRVQRH